MFKTALAVYLMTEVKDGELVFATPKIADGIKGRIEPTLKVFEGCLSKHGLRYRFNLIGGQNFYDQIESCVKQKGCVACDNELYMRSIEIHNMNPIQIATKKK